MKRQNGIGNKERALGLLLCVLLLVGFGCSTSDSGVDPSPGPGPTPPDGGTETVYDAIVIGGGIAGLSAGHYLRGKNIKVLERESTVGGRAVSGTYEGFTYALGAEYLGEPEGSLRSMLSDLNLSPVEIPEPMDGRFYDGEFYFGEDDVSSVLADYSSQAEYNRFVNTIKGLADEYDDIPNFDLSSELAPLDDITARQWFVQNGFGAIFQETYNVASRGLFGASIDEVSALSYIPEIAFDYVNTASIPHLKGMRGRRATLRAADGSEAFTFVTGITEVTAAIGNELGDKLVGGAEVTSVTAVDGNYKVTYNTSSAQGLTFTARGIILAVPAPVALQIAGGILADEQKNIMRAIPYSPYVTVALFSDEPVFNRAFDLAVPDGYFFTDVYDSTWVQRAMDPALKDKRKYIIGIYIAPNSYGDASLLTLSDNDLLNRVYADLDRVFAGASGKITGYDIHRFTYGYPVMTTGAYRRLTRLHEITTGKVQLAGDYMVYPTFEAAVESGYAAAKKLEPQLN